MIVGLIEELSVVGIYDRGVPNQERIVLFVNTTINLGQYGIMLGIRDQAGTARPIRDNLFWFGDGIVNKGDWLFLYTGPGEPRFSTVPNNPEKIFTLHWGRNVTILGEGIIVPILFKVESVQVPISEPNLLEGHVEN
jgi:hypothetical protein